MLIQQELENKKRWGNNAPKDIFYIDKIISFFPNAKIVVCVRDPRDFLLSYKFKWRATSKEHVDRIKNLYHPVLTSLVWKSSVGQIAKVKKHVKEGNWILVKYEDLVADPEAKVKAICNCIDEEYEPNMLKINSFIL